MRFGGVFALLGRCMLALYIGITSCGLLLGATAGLKNLAALGVAVAVGVLAFLVLPRITKLLSKQGVLRAGLLLVLLCALVKAAWIVLVRLEPAGDYATFWQCANSLAARETIYNGRYIALFPHIFGYASFLSWFVRLFGSGELLAPWINVLLSVCSGVLLFRLGWRWLNLEAGISAFLLWTFCPSQTIYNSMVLSEPYYTTMLLGFLLLMTEFSCTCQAVSWPAVWGAAVGVIGGLLLRFINGSRPIAAIPIIALLIWLFALGGLKGRKGIVCWFPCLALLLAVYFGTAPLWNANLAHRIGQEPSSTPGYNILVGFNPESAGTWNQADSDLLYYYSDQPGATAQWAQEQMLSEAKTRITSGEVRIPSLMVQKLRTFLGSDAACVRYSATVLNHQALFTFLCNAYYYLLLLLAVLGGLCLCMRSEGNIALLLPLYVLGLTLAQMLVEVAPRYHYSLIPMFILIGQFALYRNVAEKRGC